MSLHFLSLPGEIRNEIYRLLLVIPKSDPPSIRKRSGPSIHPQILYVCKQAHNEASAILYRENTFMANESLLTSMPRLRGWYGPLTANRYIKMITRYHMYVRLDCDARFVEESATSCFSNLDELSVEVFQAQFGSSGYEKLKLLEGIRGVKSVRLFGSLTAFPEYATWLREALVSPVDAVVEPYIEIVTPETVEFDPWSLST
jgi:hypothetical protein